MFVVNTFYSDYTLSVIEKILTFYLNKKRLNTGYREIVSIRGRAAAGEVKDTFQGISSSQETLLKVFRRHNAEYEKRTGVNIAKGTFGSYKNNYFHLE